MEGFISALFASFAGALIAFFLDRLAFRIESDRTRKINKSKLVIALRSILKSIEYNKQNLISLENTFADGSIKVVLPLNTFTWDVYKEDVFSFMSDESLRNELIRFFLVAHTLKYVSDSYFLLFGQKVLINEKSSDFENYISSLRKNVENYSKELLDRCENLIPKLKRLIAED